MHDDPSDHRDSHYPKSVLNPCSIRGSFRPASNNAVEPPGNPKILPGTAEIDQHPSCRLFFLKILLRPGLDRLVVAFPLTLGDPAEEFVGRGLVARL